MKEYGEITGPRGWIKTLDSLPTPTHHVCNYGSYAFVWIVVNGEAKSAIYKDDKFLVNGKEVKADEWMDYDECTETRPKSN